MSDDLNAEANREKTLFVSFPADEPWTAEELDRLVESIDSVTPENVGVMLAPDSIEYADRDSIIEYGQMIADAIEEVDG